MMQEINNISLKDRFMKFLDDFAPPGIGTDKELSGFIGGLMGAWVLSLRFIKNYSEARALLYHDPGTKRVLIEGAVMTDFSILLGDSLISFQVFAVFFLSVVVWHYLCYRQGSKSIYLMKRLPSRWEIHKRAWTLPLLAVAATVATAFVVMLFYYWIYMVATPKQCIAPGQWQNIWR